MLTRYLFGLPFVTVRCDSGPIEAVLDTGFNGELLLPKQVIREFDLQRVGSALYTMADGASAEAEIFSLELEWFNERRIVHVVASTADLPLMGMELLHNVKTTLCPVKNLLKVELVE